MGLEFQLNNAMPPIVSDKQGLESDIMPTFNGIHIKPVLTFSSSESGNALIKSDAELEIAQ